MLKRIDQIIGLPIISIHDGKEVGMIQQVVINPAEGRIEAFLLDCMESEGESQVLLYPSIFYLGPDALTIENREPFCSLADSPKIALLLEQNIQVSGTRVFTRTGRLIGRVGEIIINSLNGEIAACGLSNPAGAFLGWAPKAGMVTFGPDVLVVEEHIDQILLAQLAELDSESGALLDGAPLVTSKPATESKKEPQEKTVVMEAGRAQAKIKSKDTGNKDTSNKDTRNKEIKNREAENSKQTSGLRLFEERQNQFLLGKRVSWSILSAEGETIAPVGVLVTPEIIAKARKSGKYQELSSSIEH